MRASPLERVLSKIAINDFGCWVFMGGRNQGGYGRISVQNRKVVTHRVTYEALIGPVPAGLDLDHFACDNRACCNPAHLRPVTRQENVLRGDTIPARHRAKEKCPAGHSYELDGYIDDNGRRRCAVCRKAQAHARQHRRQRAA